MDGIPAKTHISLQVPTDVLDGIEQIARALERDRSWVMLRALRAYVAGEGAEVLAEAEGIASLERDEAIDYNVVHAEAEAIIAEARARVRQKVG
jgi:predicted transcriptional regulator